MVTGLQSQVASMVAYLKADEIACPEHVAQAEKHVATLMSGPRMMLDHSAQTRMEATAPRRRLGGKSYPAPPSSGSVMESARVRHTGKQPAKRSVRDFFKPKLKQKPHLKNAAPPRVVRAKAAPGRRLRCKGCPGHLPGHPSCWQQLMSARCTQWRKTPQTPKSRATCCSAKCRSSR